jgi:tRNA C32,U32 (ribose-2'-O)-methylase TrmJ
VRNIRAIFQRAGLTLQEVRTLRGIVASLVRTSNGRKPL